MYFLIRRDHEHGRVGDAGVESEAGKGVRGNTFLALLIFTGISGI